MENQYFSVTLIESADDRTPDISVDIETVAPDTILKIGNLNIHLTRERLAELGTIAINGAMLAGERK